MENLSHQSKEQLVVLSSGGTLLPLCDILQFAYPDYEKQHIRRILSGKMESLIDKLYRYDQAKLNMLIWRAHLALDLGIPPYPYHPLTVDSQGNVDVASKLKDKRSFKNLVEELCKTIHSQIEEYGLRSRGGYLLYSLYEIESSHFNDIVLTRWSNESVNHV